MKKKIFAIALMALATAGTSTIFAANPNKKSANSTCAQTECQAPDSCCRPTYCPFQGLNLTADQQAKVKALGEESAKQLQAAAKKARDARKTDATSKRAAYLAKVKTILTPEQYVQFLENAYTNQGPRGPKFEGRHGDRKAQAFNRQGRDGKQGGKRQAGQLPKPQAETK